MTEMGQATTTLDEKADRILEDLGLDPEGGPEQFTFEVGHEFGFRFAEALTVEAELFEEFLREMLLEFASLFPRDPDSDVIELQAYLLGPLVSLFLTGRGLTIPEMATLAGVNRQHAYRVNRMGLSMIYAEQAPPVKSGVNRRFSGRDDRETHHIVDVRGFVKKPWPEPLDSIQPFLLGTIAGMKVFLERPVVKAQLEPALMRAFANLLADPGLGDLMDGVVSGLDRVAQGLRDQVFVMKAEKEKAIEFQTMLAEIRVRRAGIVRVLAYTGECIEMELKPEQSKIEVLLRQ
jgi:hypothetical protein